MANTLIEDITAMYQADYEPGLIAALQCSVNKMEGTMQVFHLTGKETEIDSIGKTEVEIRTKRMQEKKFEELNWRKRFMRPAMLVKSLTMSKDDLKIKGKFAARVQNLQDELVKAATRAQMYIALGITFNKDPEANAYTVPGLTAKATAAGVTSPYSSDNTYMGGLFGYNQVSLDDGSTRTEEELPQQPMLTTGDLATGLYTGFNKSGDLDMEKTNVINANYVLSGTPKMSDLTLTKMRAAREALETRHAIESDELMYMMITPRQKSMLVNDTKLQKECGWQILKDGLMSELLGMRLITTNYVPKVKVGDKWMRACPVWSKEAMGFGMWDTVEYRAYELNQLSYDQIAVDFQACIGAARLQTERILTIHCDEDAEAV